MSNIMQHSAGAIVARLAVLVLFTLAASYISDRISEPKQLDVTKQYIQEYDALSTGTFSEREFEDLKRREQDYFDQLNSPENTGEALGHIITYKLIVVPCVALSFSFIGFCFGIGSRLYLGVALALLGGCSLIMVGLLESFIYVLSFGIANLYSIRNKRGRSQIK